MVPILYGLLKLFWKVLQHHGKEDDQLLDVTFQLFYAEKKKEEETKQSPVAQQKQCPWGETEISQVRRYSEWQINFV